MFIAKHTDNTVVTGVEWENHLKKNGSLKPRLSCLICAKPVKRSKSVNHVVDYFFMLMGRWIVLRLSQHPIHIDSVLS
jgi:hypothetical protein